MAPIWPVSAETYTFSPPLNRTIHAGSGYLSSAYAPFSLGSDPAGGGFKVQDLSLPGGVTEDRFNTRRGLLDAVNDHFRSKEKSDNLDAMDTFYQRAYGLISSQEAREAFNIDAEDSKLRDEYGRNDLGHIGFAVAPLHFVNDDKLLLAFFFN